MNKESFSWSVRIRLCVMMFLQFMMYAVWCQQLAVYLNRALGVTGYQLSLILSVQALGCMTAPIIGAIADRKFASEKVLAVLNLVGAGLLVWAARQTDPYWLFAALLLHMFCYMPTWGLTSAIAMAHSPAEKFPQIRVFGSIGWVAASIFGLVAWHRFHTKIDGTAIPLYCGAGLCVVAGLFAFALPHTPPPARGQKASLIDILGLRGALMLRDFHFALFIVITILQMVLFSNYWTFGSLFLNDQGFKLLTSVMNLGPIVETVLMLLLPLAVIRFGLKWAMAMGLVGYVIRYAAFSFGCVYGYEWPYYMAIMVHGLIFAFFFIGGQIYVDRKAPKEIRAQAQAFLSLTTFTLGLFAGNFINGELISRNSTKVVAVAEGFALSPSAQLGADKASGKDIRATDVRLYGRVLEAQEIEILASGEKKADRLKQEAKRIGKLVDLDKDLIHRGDLAGLAGKKAPSTLTFAANVVLPETNPDSPLNATLFQIGEGDSGLTLALKDDTLSLMGGKGEILAKAANLPRGKDEGDNDQPIHVAGTFDGKQISLFIGGTAYQIYDWKPIWTSLLILSVVLLAAFVFLFRDDSQPQV